MVTRPLNELRVTGAFSLVDLHSWVTLALPEVPPNVQARPLSVARRDEAVAAEAAAAVLSVLRSCGTTVPQAGASCCAAQCRLWALWWCSALPVGR